MIAEATMIAEAMMVAEVTNEQPVVEPNISPEIKAPETEQKNASGAKKSRSSRRKRMELRRLNPGGNPAGDFSNSSDQGSSSKKKRSEIRIEEPTAAAVEEEPPLTGCTKYGSIAHLGRRREMEDAVASEVEFSTRGGRSYDFYGVYDGHGGRQVAQECEEKMHAILAKAIAAAECGGEIGWEEALTTAFKDMDVEVNRPGSDVNTTGSTAVVAVVGQQELVVANCGDSRAVLCRGGVAVPLSDDHKPDRADELERIETLGGKVINWNGARVLGVLATSRSIGDEYLKPFVITDPDVKVINRTNADEFLILASDGLWDVISNDLACHVTRRCLDGRMRRSVLFTRLMNNEKNLQFDYKMNNKRCMEAAALLAEVALARGSCDNVSVVVVDVSGW